MSYTERNSADPSSDGDISAKYPKQLVKKSGGYVGRVLGEVLHIMRCVPRTVTIRRTKKCYNELPIVVNNASKFMAPVTSIIQTYAEEVDYNRLMPPCTL
ncbi:hypothetical protein JTB14_033796 [Gonioctena quinquepunctata]|nr:hypothetical protein JTB14_033796 [Gonioctena quinquepunctata]